MSEIELKGITKSFQGSTEVVSDLDLTIEDGSFVCLLGPSGCGKTTTLRMIAGLERPSRGEIRVGNRIISSSETGEYVAPEKRGMGLVFQSYALWPHLSVYDHIAFGLKMQKWSKDQTRAKVEELVELLQLGGTENRYPNELSGGQQQRVALARMLAIDPDVLLLDEPLSNLDANLRLRMRSELKRLHDELKNTVVFVTHDQLEALTLATEVAVMNEGRLEQMGPPMQVYRQPATRFVAEFVGGPPMNFFESDKDDVARTLIEAVVRAGGLDGDNPDTMESAGVRPEDLRMATSATPAGPHEWECEALVETILPTGSLWIVGIRVAGTSAFWQTASDPDIAPGARVQLRAHVADIHVFRADGSRAQAVTANNLAYDIAQEATP